MTERIEHGILDQQWALRETSDIDELKKTIGDACLAEELGFDSYMLGEHHFIKPAETFSARIPWPELVVSRIAGVTDTIRIGTGVKVLSLDEPWRTAELMLTLDLITEGRSIYGLGAGGDEPEIFRDASVGPDGRRLLFREALVELLSVLRTNGLSTFGKELSPARDAQSIIDRIWVAARDEPTIALAAEQQLNFIIGQAEPAASSAPYAATYREHGGTGDVRVVRIVHVAADSATALDGVRKAYDIYSSFFVKLRYYQEAAARLYPTPTPTSYADGLQRMCFVVGRPDDVARELAEQQQSIGADRIDVLFDIPGLATRDRHESMRLFAHEVAPALADLRSRTAHAA